MERPCWSADVGTRHSMLCNQICQTVYVPWYTKGNILIYTTYFHPILSYCIIFWGNSAYRFYISKIQKRIFGVNIKARDRDSCLQLFKKLKILPLKSQYIFFLSFFVTKNGDLKNQIQKFIISTPDLVLPYIVQLQT